MNYAYKAILMMILASALLRYLPFIIFSHNDSLPIFIKRLGKNLPLAAMGMLIIYCLKDISFTSGTFGIPEIISILFVMILYKKTNSNLISIFIPTLFYLLLVNVILA